MLQWDELSITPDGKYLVIDVQVQDSAFYNNIYIESIYMNAYSKSEDFNDGLENAHTIHIWRDYTTPESTYTDKYKEVGEQGQTYRHLRKCVDIDLIKDNLLFITATNNNAFAPDTPCSCKKTMLLGIVYNKQILYKNSISALQTLNGCTPSKELIDHILNIKAFELSLGTGDYKSAIGYWNNIFKNNKVVSHTKCHCHD